MFRWWTRPTLRRRPDPAAAATASGRWAPACLAAALTGLAPVPATATLDRAALVEIGASVLKVEALRRQGGYAMGSAVVIGPERVVTNCHVTRDATAIAVSRGDLRLSADAQAAEPGLDLCVLRVRQLRAPAVPFGQASGLRAAQSVTAIGYTGGAGIQFSAGEVVALHRLEGSHVVQSTNWFSSGASGGGLFDDAGRLVGVLTFRLRGGEAHYYAAPAEWVQRLAADHGRLRPIAPLPGAEAAYWQRPLETQPPFLRAAWLERDRRWNDLALLGASWSDGDAGNPEAWYVRGVALHELGLGADARAALERAVASDPDYALAWLRLGTVCAQRREFDRAREAEQRLRTLQPDYAARLQEVIAHAS